MLWGSTLTGEGSRKTLVITVNLDSVTISEQDIRRRALLSLIRSLSPAHTTEHAAANWNHFAWQRWPLPASTRALRPTQNPHISTQRALRATATKGSAFQTHG